MVNPQLDGKASPQHDGKCLTSKSKSLGSSGESKLPELGAKRAARLRLDQLEVFDRRQYDGLLRIPEFSMGSCSRHRPWPTRRSRRAHAQPEEHRRHAAVGKLIIVTGVSGSGKSSLAFDTIYAEGQRRYVESLSAYARQFLERMEKPDVDRIEGICPAIAIRQKNSIRNPRSTVGTTTEIHDYMRLLFARVGRTYLPAVRPGGRPRDGRGRGAAAGRAAGGTRVLIGFEMPVVAMPLRRGPTGRRTRATRRTRTRDDALRSGLRKRSSTLRRRGFGRLLVDGRAVRLRRGRRRGAAASRTTLEVVVDRVRSRATCAAG